jgi:hypothetical protein
MWGNSDIAVQPETVGEQVIRAVQTDELYIFCDGTASREMFEERTRAMSDAFDRQFPRWGYFLQHEMAHHCWG